MKRININFSDNLLYEIKRTSKELNMNLSEFVREATEVYASKIKEEKLKKELIEGYKAKAKLNLKICEDFKYTDGENV
ncbi:hypothetical protein ES702_05597 [subsurface metagenome]